MKTIVLHDSYSNNPIVIRHEAINVLRKIEKDVDSKEELTEVTVGDMCFIVKENIGEVILKIKKAESEGFKVGDLIRCNSAQDMVITDFELIKAGYTTGYAYRVNGEDGLWIEIRGVKK